MSFKVRTTFYSLTLAFGVFQTAIASTNLVVSSHRLAPLMPIVTAITLGWSLATWIWTSVLLFYNHRPLSSHGLARALPHFVSFTVFAVGWLPLTITLGQQFPLQCDFKTYSDGEAYSWCALGASSFGLSFLLFASCVTSAAVAYSSARRTGAGLSANVAHDDKMVTS